MEKVDVKQEPENAPERGNFPKIGNSDYRFNLWYKFPKMIENTEEVKKYDNYGGDHNFASDDLIDYMRESMSGIKLIEDFDEHEDYLSGKVLKYYRVEAFIPERECGIDPVYAQKKMKSFNEIDFEKSGEWIAKMLEKLGAVLDVDKCIELIEEQQAEAKALIDSNNELFEIVGESNEKFKKALNGDKSKEE
jgi:hypothetical protein